MSEQIFVNHEEVQGQTERLVRKARTQVAMIGERYGQIQSSLGGMDGETNALLCEAMAKNERKAILVSEILIKLLTFIEGSATQINMRDQRSAAHFSETLGGG